MHDLTFTVDAGEFVAVVGPTGCGNSTTLSLVSGLEPPSSGEVEVDGAPEARTATAPRSPESWRCARLALTFGTRSAPTGWVV